jgi:hypothetical protein
VVAEEREIAEEFKALADRLAQLERRVMERERERDRSVPSEG